LTITEFAEHLGVTTRAVDKWEARGVSITPRPELQRALDTVLSSADPAVRARLIPEVDVPLHAGHVFDGAPREEKLQAETGAEAPTVGVGGPRSQTPLDETSDRIPRDHESPEPGRILLRRQRGSAVARAAMGVPHPERHDPPSYRGELEREPPGLTEPRSLRTEEGETRRRDVLRLGRDASLAYLLDSVVKESIELRTALASSDVPDGHLAVLEAEAAEIGLGIVRVPHLLLLERALAHGRVVRRLMYEARTSGQRRRLERLISQFALAVGEILFMEGSFREADSWYSVARTAASDSGDEDLVDLALASSAYLPSYSDDPQGVLALVVPRLEHRRGASPGSAWLWAFRAKAEASLGQKSDFVRSIERSREVLGSVAPEEVFPGIFSFTGAKLAFYETSGYVRLGRIQPATTAAVEALNLYDQRDTSERALVRLEYAVGLAAAQQPEEACRVAAAAVGDPYTAICSTVLKRAKDFDRSLPHGRGPEFSQWRDALQAYRVDVRDQPSH
jgi:hypothetical protein